MKFNTLNYLWSKATFGWGRGKIRFRKKLWKVFFMELFLNLKTLVIFGKTFDELNS